MANKTFYLDRDTDPLNPALEVANKDELIKVYDDASDMESDISNIEDDEIVSCKGNDYEGVHVTDTVSNGNLNPVTSNAVYQAIDNLTQYNPNYVLGEIDTGATWIDGKHIYRSVVNFGALPSGGVKSVNHGITGIDTIVNVRGITYNSSGNTFPLPFVSMVAVNGILFAANKTQVTVETGTDRSSYSTTYAFIEYTKSE